jgi:hypothetical protein
MANNSPGQEIEIEPNTPPVDVEKAATETQRTTSHAPSENIPYTIFTLNEKRFMVFILAFAALFSPISSTIYYPALDPLARELHVSDSLINITITTFMVNLLHLFPS